jgi:sec-independent protein translocase protein TatC
MDGDTTDKIINEPENESRTQDPEAVDEMTFLEHLEEFRWRLIKSIIGIIIGGIIVAIFVDWVMNEFLLYPALRTNPPLTLQNIKPYGQFALYMEVIIFGGLILSVPNILYQFWRFIEPALKQNERKYIFWIVFFTSLCFLSGIAFAYYVLLPTALDFFASFGTTAIHNIIAINEYFSFVIRIILAAGLVFELPMITFFLSKLGILKPQYMKKYRKHSIVVILIVAAIATPPDIVSQVLLAIPLILLYELSILICKYSQPKK